MNITLKETLVRDIIAELENADFRTVENMELVNTLIDLLRIKSNSQTNNGLQKAVTAILKRSKKIGRPSLMKCTEENGKYYVSDSYIAICMKENFLNLELYEEKDKITWKNIFKDFLEYDEEVKFELSEVDEWLSKARKEKKKAVYWFSESCGVDCGMLKEAILATGNSTALVAKSMIKINSENVRALVCGIRNSKHKLGYDLIAK